MKSHRQKAAADLGRRGSWWTRILGGGEVATHLSWGCYINPRVEWLSRQKAPITKLIWSLVFSKSTKNFPQRPWMNLVPDSPNSTYRHFKSDHAPLEKALLI